MENGVVAEEYKEKYFTVDTIWEYIVKAQQNVIVATLPIGFGYDATINPHGFDYGDGDGNIETLEESFLYIKEMTLLLIEVR